LSNGLKEVFRDRDPIVYEGFSMGKIDRKALPIIPAACHATVRPARTLIGGAYPMAAAFITPQA